MERLLSKFFIISLFMLNINYSKANVSLVKEQVIKGEKKSQLDQNELNYSNDYYKLLYENAKESNAQMITMLQWY